jgi:hypothetical protein
MAHINVCVLNSLSMTKWYETYNREINDIIDTMINGVKYITNSNQMEDYNIILREKMLRQKMIYYLYSTSYNIDRTNIDLYSNL